MKLTQAIIISLLFVLPVSLYAQELNKFESVTVGFEVTKPGDWLFATAQENLKQLKNAKSKDEQLKQLMLKHATAPLVVIVKYHEPFDDINPSFKVKIKPLGKLKGADPKEILTLIIPQYKRLFPNYALAQAPIDTTIGNLPAAYMRVNYSLNIPDGRTFPTACELWVVPRGDYFFMIFGETRQDEKTGTRAELSKILSSVVL
ncbi:MAG: hypothetical protein OCC45_13935 [Desulfotalea sp.]